MKKYKKERNLLILAKEHCEKILENPNLGEPLTGNPTGLLKYAFRYGTQDYRLIYALHDCCQNESCKFDINPEPNLENCAGRVKFIWLKSREECNNLYAETKGFFKQYIEEEAPITTDEPTDEQV